MIGADLHDVMSLKVINSNSARGHQQPWQQELRVAGGCIVFREHFCKSSARQDIRIENVTSLDP